MSAPGELFITEGELPERADKMIKPLAKKLKIKEWTIEVPSLWYNTWDELEFPNELDTFVYDDATSMRFATVHCKVRVVDTRTNSDSCDESPDVKISCLKVRLIPEKKRTATDE